MKTKRNVPEAWKQQWDKSMIHFFDYVPQQYEVDKQGWAVRRLVWDFKDGKKSHVVAKLVAERLLMQFGSFAEDVTLVCLPASSAEKNEIRYKDFAEEVAEITGCKNAYRAITIEGGRMAIHERHGQKELQEVEVINFDKEFFNGKRCIIFDDVLTTGRSYARFACLLENMGAEVLGGYFLGKTILN